MRKIGSNFLILIPFLWKFFYTLPSPASQQINVVISLLWMRQLSTEYQINTKFEFEIVWILCKQFIFLVPSPLMITSHLTFPHPLSLVPLITKYVDDPCIKLFILSRSGQQPGRQLHLVFAKDHLSCSIIYLLTSSCNSNKWSTTIDKGIIILSSQLQPSFSLRTIFSNR